MSASGFQMLWKNFKAYHFKIMKKNEKINGKYHPCNCTDYNGSQCYNCLNGFHKGCSSKCNKKNSKQMGVILIFKKNQK